jgi:hypothetical protein
MTLDDLAKQFEAMRVDMSAMRGDFADLRKTMHEGFDASRIRDEELRDLMKFGLEAREVLRDEVHRRFDDADRKHDEQIDLLKTVIRHDVTKR